MTDLEYTFAIILHNKLREKIEGKIYVKVTRNDELLIIIQTYGDIEYKVFIDNFSDKVLHGYSTDYAVYEIVRDYKKFILHKFFR